MCIQYQTLTPHKVVEKCEDECTLLLLLASEQVYAEGNYLCLEIHPVPEQNWDIQLRYAESDNRKKRMR